MKKPLCVFLHGYPNNPLLWKEQIEKMQDQFTILNLALPGSTNGLVSQSELKLEKIVRNIVAEITAQNKDEIILIGHDVGSFILSEVSKHLSNKVKAQVFMAGMDFKLFRKRLLSSTQFFKSWYVFLLQIPGLSEAFVAKFRPLLSKNVYDMSHIAENASLRTEAPFGFTPIGLYRELRTGMFLSTPKKSQVPTLLLFGKDDKFIKAPNSQDIRPFYSEAEVKVLDGGHWFLRENPELVNQTIQNFLQKAAL
ncbi:alpha/beta fold hydrolase [Peredibacter starrii]|uniref:Alpha/beta hydrolase n=1 Tax=Peredibacter starrii TaxID=28202 RepID=A0AAX4HLS3_9BACT|nr:alpha/beta hydrolase [Peredibacter starrii]WPU64210.1 alpha/beta hydrolase [Peredibacter starrii]